ncbi:YceI family protein [Aldersonia sp. NBC_00410]|uniref:YceI family protein n=1 Tax=Aldersonia sp. NBC_00410 TaxID=2975954 RepID=UPI00224E7E40|nr:YceI family protein [Aldersonia sp. NBC_00410]MCX5041901.1 YceI family protein [Aldersonia sp. NBC_00410]
MTELTTTAAQPVASGRWTIDCTESTATFAVRDLGRTVNGSVPVSSGEICFDRDGRLVSVCGTVDLAAIDTGNQRRDKDLRNPRFLDLDTHSSARFVADEITPDSDGWAVAGTLTMRGTPVPVCFHAHRDPEVSGLVVRAEARVDRREFGIRAPRVLIGHTITMRISATLVPAP